MEDLKSAEQLVKKKQQQENAQRTTELQNLAHHSNSDQVGVIGSRFNMLESDRQVDLSSDK